MHFLISFHGINSTIFLYIRLCKKGECVVPLKYKIVLINMICLSLRVISQEEQKKYSRGKLIVLEETFTDKINKKILLGLNYLKNQQMENGSWTLHPNNSNNNNSCPETKRMGTNISQLNLAGCVLKSLYWQAGERNKLNNKEINIKNFQKKIFEFIKNKQVFDKKQVLHGLFLPSKNIDYIRIEKGKQLTILKEHAFITDVLHCYLASKPGIDETLKTSFKEAVNLCIRLYSNQEYGWSFSENISFHEVSTAIQMIDLLYDAKGLQQLRIIDGLEIQKINDIIKKGVAWIDKRLLPQICGISKDDLQSEDFMRQYYSRVRTHFDLSINQLMFIACGYLSLYSVDNNCNIQESRFLDFLRTIVDSDNYKRFLTNLIVNDTFHIRNKYEHLYYITLAFVMIDDRRSNDLKWGQYLCNYLMHNQCKEGFWVPIGKPHDRNYATAMSVLLLRYCSYALL